LGAFATLLGGVTAGLAGQDAQAGALSGQNEALNNAGDHPDQNELLGTAKQLVQGLIDRAKWTFNDPVGDTERGIDYFLSAGNRN